MRSIAVLVVTVCLAMAGNISVTLTLSPDNLNIADQNGYAVCDFTEVPHGTAPAYTNRPGEPLLPMISGNVLIPAGAEVENIAVTPLARVELGVFRVHPAQPMRPLSQLNSVPFVGPDAQTYGSDAVYPSAPLQTVPAGSKAGFRVAGYIYCPFEYRPASGRLSLVTRARIDVSYREHAVAAPVLTFSQRDFVADDVRELVMNHQDVARFAPAAAEKDAGEVDVVIFTNGTMASSVLPLRDWLARKGYHTVVIRHDTLANAGRDVPEKMRNVVKRLFAENGLKYVILGGDDGTCPVRYGYLPYSTYTVPADMYFGDLDGSWNGNNNSYWGEMYGDSVDLFHDVYVGRLPYDNATHFAAILRKDTMFELAPDSASLRGFIGGGEWLWQNIGMHGMFVNRVILRNLNAMAGPWVTDTGMNLSPTQVITATNAGRQFFHFAGHGSSSAFGSTFSTSNLGSLTNINKPMVVNSIACDCGWFDGGTECLGEQYVTVSNGGAAATMLNARYGWGAPPCLGPNDNLDVQFYNNYAKGLTVGQSHGLARDFLRNESFSQMTMRWAMYTNTLQGDPTMRMWRTQPVVLSVDAPDTIAAMPQQLVVAASCGYAPVKGARCAVLHLGELIGRAVTGSDGYAYVALPQVEDTWTLKLVVTAQDARQWEKTVATRAGCAAALVGYDHKWVDDPNGRLDPYEASDVYLVVRNTGNAPATAVSGVLRSRSPYVTVVDSTASYGDVAIGDTARGDAYRVWVSRDCPHGHAAEFQLNLTGSDGNWVSPLEMVVGLPKARGGHWATIDTGDYCLTVCANGGIGTTWYSGEGYGFIYPKVRQWSSSALMHGGLLLGTDTSWVADNFYGTPWQVCPEDFRMEESLRIVVPARVGHQEYRCVFSDARHQRPKGLVVTHGAYASANQAHKDFVVLEYRIRNSDTVPVSGLYVGVACDFRTPGWNVNDSFDYAGVDSARKLAYVKSHSSGETLTLGIRHIYPEAMNGYANCISAWQYVVDGFTKSEKMRFLDGTLRATNGTNRANYIAMTSSGPYAIPAGDEQTVAFVICGGRTVTQMTANSDTAAGWFNPPVGVVEPTEPAFGLVRMLDVRPAVFATGVTVRYGLARAVPLPVRVLDASGRVVEQFELPAAKAGTFVWRPRAREDGIYFLRVGDLTTKLVRAQ